MAHLDRHMGIVSILEFGSCCHDLRPSLSNDAGPFGNLQGICYFVDTMRNIDDGRQIHGNSEHTIEIDSVVSHAVPLGPMGRDVEHLAVSNIGVLWSTAGEKLNVPLL